MIWRGKNRDLNRRSDWCATAAKRVLVSQRNARARKRGGTNDFQGKAMWQRKMIILISAIGELGGKFSDVEIQEYVFRPTKDNRSGGGVF